MTLGWECPKCGAVMAPHIDVCVNCKGISWVVTTTADYYGCDHDWSELIQNTGGSYYECRKCGIKHHLSTFNN